MASVTEFVCFEIKYGLDIMDKTTEEGKAPATFVSIALEQKGCQRVYYGRESEKPENLWMFLDWDDVQDHANFGESDKYEKSVDLLRSILNLKNGFIKHVQPKPYPPKAPLADAPITEVLTLFFPENISAEAKADAEARLDEFTSKALESCSAVNGVSYGWSLENDVPVRGDKGKTGVMLVAFVGWESLSAHMEFRDREEFKANIGLLRDIPNKIGLSAFHVDCVSSSRS